MNEFQLRIFNILTAKCQIIARKEGEECSTNTPAEYSYLQMRCHFACLN